MIEYTIFLIYLLENDTLIVNPPGYKLQRRHPKWENLAFEHENDVTHLHLSSPERCKTSRNIDYLHIIYLFLSVSLKKEHVRISIIPSLYLKKSFIGVIIGCYWNIKCPF